MLTTSTGRWEEVDHIGQVMNIFLNGAKRGDGCQIFYSWADTCSIWTCTGNVVGLISQKETLYSIEKHVVKLWRTFGIEGTIYHHDMRELTGVFPGFVLTGKSSLRPLLFRSRILILGLSRVTRRSRWWSSLLCTDSDSLPTRCQGLRLPFKDTRAEIWSVVARFFCYSVLPWWFLSVVITCLCSQPTLGHQKLIELIYNICVFLHHLFVKP